MCIPFFDSWLHNQNVQADLRSAIQSVIDSGQYILGPAVERFEKHFAAYLGVQHCIGVNSGTSALHLALLAGGVGLGDEVITTPLTWISTAAAISLVGARPVFADIDPVSYTMDVEKVERAITRRTKALLPVHLYGQPADLDGCQRLAEQHGLLLIEDAAQAHGAWYGNRRAGTIGQMGCFSFYPSKNLGALGEGGAVVTDNDSLARRLRRLRNHGQDTHHVHLEPGFNARMEALQGAVLSAKLPYLEGWNTKRAVLAALYHELLVNTLGLTLPAKPLSDRSHVWHLFVIQVIKRDELQSALANHGVETRVHYPTPLHLQPAFSSLGYKEGDFPIAEGVTQHCLSLPLYPELTEADIRCIVSSLTNTLPTTTTVTAVQGSGMASAGCKRPFAHGEVGLSTRVTT